MLIKLILKAGTKLVIHLASFSLSLACIANLPQGSFAEGESCGGTHVTDADRQTLEKATALVYKERGDSNQACPEWLAFQKFLKIGKLADLSIKDLLQKATPAGRLYAVILLRELDPVSAAQALSKMKSQSDKLIYAKGCCVESTTLADMARRIEKGEIIVDMSRK